MWRRPASEGPPRDVGADGHPSIEGFEVGEPIDSGGFSVVYRARQSTPTRTVAIKVFRTGGAIGKRHRERFQREATVVGELSSLDGVVTVFTGGFTRGGAPYLAMELCGGGSLEHRLRTAGPMPVTDVVAVAGRIGSVLEQVHACGACHRDVKPSNILSSTDGRWLLTDFGLSVVAELTDELGDESRMAMTEVYAPPERLDPSQDRPALDELGDQYSLAATLYAMLLGGPPFRGTTGTQRALRALEGRIEPLDRPDVSGEMLNAIRRGMARSPSDRWPTVGAMVDAMWVASGRKQGAPPPRVAQQPDWSDSPTILRGGTGPEAAAARSLPATASAPAPRPTVDPEVEAGDTTFAARSVAAERLAPPPAPEATQRIAWRWILGGTAAGVALLVLTLVLLGGRGGSDAPAASDQAAAESMSEPVLGQGEGAPGLPMVEAMRRTDDGLVFTWMADVAPDSIALYQVQVDRTRASLAQPIDQTGAGELVEEQFVDTLTFEGGVTEAVDLETHSYCVVVLVVPIQGDPTQSEEQCLGA